MTRGGKALKEARPRTVLQSKGVNRDLRDLAIGGESERDFVAGLVVDLGLEADLVEERNLGRNLDRVGEPVRWRLRLWRLLEGSTSLLVDSSAS